MNKLLFLGFPLWYMLFLILIASPIGCNNAPQLTQVPAVALAKPQASPSVVLLVKSAERGDCTGRDVTILRFFVANRERLIPEDVDYLTEHSCYNSTKGFITAEYYAKAPELESKKLP